MVEKLKKIKIGKKYPFHQPIKRQHSYIRWNYKISYTLYQNAVFWLVDERGIILFTNSEFFQLFHHCWGICLIITLHRDACDKICETLSVVRFIAKSYLPFLPFSETLVTKFVKRYQLCVLLQNHICRFYPSPKRL